MINPFEAIEIRLEKMEIILTNLREILIQRDEIRSVPSNKLIKIDEAVVITGYKRGYLYELIHRNKIPFIKRGRSIRFDPAELEMWMRANRPDIIKETIKRLK